MKVIKDNRVFSFLVIFIAYILAFAIGLFVYRNLSFSLYVNIFIADVVATIFIYLVGLVFKNASIYDPYWSVQPLVILPLIMIMFKNFSFSAILFASFSSACNSSLIEAILYSIRMRRKL